MPNFIPFSGAECFWDALDREARWRRSGLQAQLVLRLEPGLDVGALAKLIQEAGSVEPVLEASTRGRLFGARGLATEGGTAAWARLRLHDSERRLDAALLGICQEALGHAPEIRRGERLHVDVIRYGGGEQGVDIAFTWSRTLFDPRTAESFVRWLDAKYQGHGRAPGPLVTEPRRHRLYEGRQRRRERSAVWRDQIRGVGLVPPTSLSGRSRRERIDPRIRSDVLDAGDSLRIRTRAAERAREPALFYLAAALRAHHAVHRVRGVAASSYVVPVPVFGETTRAGQSIDSLLWMQVLGEQVVDFTELLSSLNQQWAAGLASGLPSHGDVALEQLARPPFRSPTRQLRRQFRGELASFLFLWADGVLVGQDHFLGARIRDAFHAPGAPVSPGCHSVVDGRGSTLRLTQIHQHGVLSAAELDILQQHWRRELLES